MIVGPVGHSEIRSSPRRILYLPRNSWGEIEWILPLLFRLKQLSPDVRIYTIFPCDRFFDESLYFPTLLQLLRHVSEKIFRPLEQIGVDTDWWTDYENPWRIVERTPSVASEIASASQGTKELIARVQASHADGRIGDEEYAHLCNEAMNMVHELAQAIDLDREQRITEIEDTYSSTIFDHALAGVPVDLILRDNGFDFRFHTLVLDRFAHVPVVRGEHGFDLTNRDKTNVDHGFIEAAISKQHLVGRGELWLSCCKNLADSFETYWGESRSAVIGFPRLDRWWIDTLLASSREEVDRMGLPQDRENILWITRQVVGSCFAEETWLKIMRSTISVFLERPGTHIIVKPHPRQDVDRLLAELQRLPKERWTLWKGSTMTAAHEADIVVSVWSSAILDALAMGKPVIEYFEYAKECFNQARDETGRVTGGWRASGLAIPADSPDEVHDLLDLWQRDPEHEVWQKQRAAFVALHDPRADHTGAAIREIQRLFDPTGREKSRLPEVSR